MGKTEKLKPRQLAVIDELFNGDDEQAVLDRHKVSRRLYNKWLADSDFVGEFDRRIDASFRQSAALIARYAPLAAAKLVQLTESDKEETARKACLDIISMHAGRTRDDGRPTKDDGRGSPDMEQGFALPDQTASRLLSALAEEKDGVELSE
jgi:alkylhydroperoxidase family enzyme